MSDALYTATATAWGGRAGKVQSDDGRVNLDLSVPSGLGGDDGPGTNPEQLFATGYAACFHGALKAIGRARGVDLAESAVSVTIGLGGTFDTGLDLSATIEAELPGVEPSLAEELLAAAHDKCPYSRATRGNIEHRVLLTGH
mgnify:CR=1 FL=1